MKQIIINIENGVATIEKIEIETQAELTIALKAAFDAFVKKKSDLPK